MAKKKIDNLEPSSSEKLETQDKAFTTGATKGILC